MKLKPPPGVMIYFNNWDPLRENLTAEELGILLNCFLDYAEYDEKPDVKGTPYAIAWGYLSQSVRQDRINYREKVVRAKYGGYKKNAPTDDQLDFKTWWAQSEDYDPELFVKEDWYSIAYDQVVEHAKNNNTTNGKNNDISRASSKAVDGQNTADKGAAKASAPYSRSQRQADINSIMQQIGDKMRIPD